MAKQTVVWEHPVLGKGRYHSNAVTPRDAAEECADIFAGQPIRIRAWDGEWGEGMKRGAPDWQIDNG